MNNHEAAARSRRVFPLGHVGIPILLAYEGLRWRALDLRWIAAGALLPDLLDKGVLWALGTGTGKAIGHSLVFTLVLAAAAWRAGGAARLVLASLALGTGSHLVLDAMWVEHDALLWPLLGWRFATYPYDPARALLALLRDPVMIAGELAGAAALVWVFVRARLHRPGALATFAREGRLDPPA